MQNEPDFSIVIVGGGFCGVMTLVNLIDKTKKSIVITLINKDYPLARGIAYNSYSELHLLNVEARNMSAFPDQPSHFVDWCLGQNEIKIPTEKIPFSYLPRNIYGKYMEELLENKINNAPDHIRIQIFNDDVTDIEKNKGRLTVSTLSGKIIMADKVVLATGNNEPGPPNVPEVQFIKSKNYFSNPWNEKAVLNLPDGDTVLIIGTGLTMVDLILGLREKNFNGKIIALSPHGYNILPHRKLPPQPYILDELSPPFKLEKLFRLFYKHVREARQRGLSGETVVDAIRERTQEIWQQLSLDDRKKFITHLRHLWGVARHRLPAFIHEQVQQMIRENKLEVIAGRIKKIAVNENDIDIIIQKRKDQSVLELSVARIINCTGPQTDIKKQKSKLFDSLLEKGFIRPDDLNQGIDATADGQVIDKKNIISNQIFAMGSLLKGKLWESTAIPELRKQAFRIAELLISESVVFESEQTALK